jgi:hypothetical protein
MGELRPDRDAGGGSRGANRDGNQKTLCRLEAGRSAALMPMKNAAVIVQKYDADQISGGSGALTVRIRA